MPLKLKAGGRYHRRDGTIVGPLQWAEGFGWFTDGEQAYTVAGNVMGTQQRFRPEDLIREAVCEHTEQEFSLSIYSYGADDSYGIETDITLARKCTSCGKTCAQKNLTTYQLEQLPKHILAQIWEEVTE